MPPATARATAAIEAEDRRVDLRHFIDLAPVLLEAETIAEHVQVVNIARRGFLARTRMHYRTGERVLLHLPGAGLLEARVVWCAKGMVGGQFAAPIEVTRIGEGEEGAG